MKDKRHGDQLWLEWEGEGLESSSDIQYYTIEHVSLDEEIVRRALASTLQRDGVADSLADGFKLLDGVEIESSWAGPVDEEFGLTICNSEGETFYGEVVSTPFPVTIVYIYA